MDHDEAGVAGAAIRQLAEETALPQVDDGELVVAPTERTDRPGRRQRLHGTVMPILGDQQLHLLAHGEEPRWRQEHAVLPGVACAACRVRILFLLVQSHASAVTDVSRVSLATVCPPMVVPPG